MNVVEFAATKFVQCKIVANIFHSPSFTIFQQSRVDPPCQVRLERVLFDDLFCLTVNHREVHHGPFCTTKNHRQVCRDPFRSTCELGSQDRPPFHGFAWAHVSVCLIQNSKNTRCLCADSNIRLALCFAQRKTLDHLTTYIILWYIKN
jgi:hypothetical protein